MSKHEVTVTMIFDDNGELETVRAQPPAKAIPIAEPDEPMPASAIKKNHDKLRIHSFLYEFGSPGCKTYKTKAGWIQICW